jgi:hypothetical protein
LGLGPLPACLAVASNRLHLYHVRVVTNDGLNVALMLAAVRLLAGGHPIAASALYSLTLAQKLNFITYLPAWMWALARSRASVWQARFAVAGGALTILAVQVAFLLCTRRLMAAAAARVARQSVRAVGGGWLCRDVGGVAQVAAGLPFLGANALAYLRGAYNLGRNLLWDKSRVFKFVGRGVCCEQPKSLPHATPRPPPPQAFPAS